MNEQVFDELLEKYISGTASPEEIVLLESWYIQQSRFSNEQVTASEVELAGKEIWQKLTINVANPQPRKTNWLRYWPAAAVVLISIMTGLYIFHKTTPVNEIAQQHIQDIAPGGNKAVLTLSNGRKIVLTGARNGQVATDNNAIIKKTADGNVVYNAQTADPGSKIVYNTMTTPRGGQYHLTLADGTGVWLNASSSIEYPIAFTGSSREVKITGEVYFEVTHDRNKPFRVSTGGQLVEVLGTHFNINAYVDEPAVTTTLLEGSVRITKAGQQALLKPGQQALIASDNPSILVKDADVNEVIAWKKGRFSFNETDIRSVMRQISRWYDVDIIYRSKVTNDKLTGTLPMNITAAKALKLLQFTGVNFTIEGRQIIIK